MIGIIKRTGKNVNLVVDTSVWSLLLRRERHDETSVHLAQLRRHLKADDAIHLIGPIVQEILDGFRNDKQFDLLVDYLEPFPLIELIRNDFIHAARLKNTCRSRGVQAGTVDFLIAAVCERRNYPLLTTDRDFEYISRYSRLLLIKP
jgi:predicted nucleic acid-binding protein